MNIQKMTDHIETKRLVLFPYTEENLSLFNSDLPRFEKEFGVVYRGEELDYLLKDFLMKLETEIAEDPDRYLFFTEFLIVLKDNDHIIGSIDYKYVPRDGMTEVGYGLNPAYEGHGYMTEALKAFLHFGKTLGIRTVLADTKPDNVKSQRVLEKCGFQFLRKEGNLWWKISLVPNLETYMPKIEDLWFREKLLGDEATMSYNHAWGGTIAFPEEDWADWYDFWLVHKEGKRFYRYLKDTDTGEFVGEIAYHYDADLHAYTANVIILAACRGKGYGGLGLDMLCSAAREHEITVLYDDIAADNPAIHLFLEHGFIEEYRTEEKVYLKKEL